MEVMVMMINDKMIYEIKPIKQFKTVDILLFY